MGEVISMIEPPKTTRKSDKIHVMVDVETLGLEANAIVLSIGACKFTLDGIYEKFYSTINPETYPGAVDLSTIKWWMDQSAAGNKAPMDGSVALPNVIGLFHKFLLSNTQDPKQLVIWANGTDFDIPKLNYAYKVCGAAVPWGYSAVRDCRTLFKTFPDYGDETVGEASHNALNDACWQATRLISIFKNMGENLLLGEFSGV